MNEPFESRCKRFVESYRSMNPRNFDATSDVKFLKSRYKRFVRSYRSMNPRNFFYTSDVKFLKRWIQSSWRLVIDNERAVSC